MEAKNPTNGEKIEMIKTERRNNCYVISIILMMFFIFKILPSDLMGLSTQGAQVFEVLSKIVNLAMVFTVGLTIYTLGYFSGRIKELS